jgi:hypothetical protein
MTRLFLPLARERLMFLPLARERLMLLALARERLVLLTLARGLVRRQPPALHVVILVHLVVLAHESL